MNVNRYGLTYFIYIFIFPHWIRWDNDPIEKASCNMFLEFYSFPKHIINVWNIVVLILKRRLISLLNFKKDVSLFSLISKSAKEEKWDTSFLKLRRAMRYVFLELIWRYVIALIFTDFIKGEGKLTTSSQAEAMFVFFHLLKHNYYLIPLAVLGLLLIDPCTPPFIMSKSVSCSTIRWNGWVILIPLFETHLCACFCYIGTASFVYNLMAGISSLLSYFQLLER